MGLDLNKKKKNVYYINNNEKSRKIQRKCHGKGWIPPPIEGSSN